MLANVLIPFLLTVMYRLLQRGIGVTSVWGLDSFPRGLESAFTAFYSTSSGSPKRNLYPPVWLFGNEPERNWCYYFEKADLARQYGEWEKVAKLGDQAFAIPYAPADAAEYLPFIEAYARLGRTNDAMKLSKIAAAQTPLLKPMLSALWERLTKENGDRLVDSLQWGESIFFRLSKS